MVVVCTVRVASVCVSPLVDDVVVKKNSDDDKDDTSKATKGQMKQ